MADLDAIIVPVGGAGLIAGVALAVKTLNPAIRVIGVEPKRCASFAAALEAGHPVPVDVAPTLADGLAVPCVGPHAFVIARQHVDEVVQVDESDAPLALSPSPSPSPSPNSNRLHAYVAAGPFATTAALAVPRVADAMAM